MNFSLTKLSQHLAEVAVDRLHTHYFLALFISLSFSHIVATQAGRSDWKRYQRSTHLTWIVSQSEASLLACWIIVGSQSWFREEVSPSPRGFILARGSERGEEMVGEEEGWDKEAADV